MDLDTYNVVISLQSDALVEEMATMEVDLHKKNCEISF
jgi:hypothetical protein